VWNRVALLASGFLLGWTLVRYWTVPRAEVHTQVLRLGVALALGAAVVALLTADSLAAGAAGSAVYAISALVAYAGNARQLNRGEEPTPLPRPSPAGAETGRRGIVLVSCHEPPTYDGPAYWAWRLRRREREGKPVPHWFARPRCYARIRSAYQGLEERASPQAAATDDALERAGRALDALLGGDCRVATARLAASPSVSQVLAGLAADGVTRLIVQPLDVPPDALDVLRAAVTQSRVREAGVRVTLAEPLPVPGWDHHEERLEQWIRGRAPELLPDIDPATLSLLKDRLSALA